ncbi:hypothetical protein N2152v2_010687 [Parachlorella kessleri]
MSSDDTSVKMKLSEESSPNVPSLLLSDDPDTVKVLGLPYAMATLGWVPGVLLLAFVTLESAYAAYLLATLHELRDGRRIKTLRALARETCGRWGKRVVVALQFFIMIGSDIVLTVAAGASIMNLVHNCFGSEGAACASHEYKAWPWTVLFGGCMLILAQLPNFHDLAIVSLMGSCMPIIYSSIALVSILVHGPEDDLDYSIIRGENDFKTAMSVLGGIGSIFFAYGGQVVQNEVTATLITPPSIMTSMKRALSVAYGVIGVGYFAVSICGYAFFGNAVTGNIMQSLPYAVPAYIANSCVVLHVAAAYQVLGMPVYHALEHRVQSLKGWNNKLSSNFMLRLVVRSTYVGICTLLAAMIPFFSQLGGLIGGMGVGPLCGVVPIVMWEVYNRGYVSRLQSAFNWTLVVLLMAVSVATTIASFEQIVDQAHTFKIFG